MSFKLSKTLNSSPNATSVDSAFREYERRVHKTRRRELEKRSVYIEASNLYYDLVTDFFEFGWGRSFHFAPRVPGESFKASLARHEHFMAHALDLKPGMVVADLGCGVGGPLLEIARFTGAKIVGVNSNAYQLEKARALAEEAEMTHLAEFLHCDFMAVDAPDGSFDAVYSIEATCHAPDKAGVYGEAFRLLKPGGRLGVYEYCLTERFEAEDPLHLRIKADIELGGCLPGIDTQETVDHALRAVGFEVLQTRDLAVQTGPHVPWYEPLVGSGLSPAGVRSSRVGRWAIHNSLRVLEGLRLVPKGTVLVSQALNLCAAGMVEAGRLGIFTPMYFLHARKPT